MKRNVLILIAIAGLLGSATSLAAPAAATPPGSKAAARAAASKADADAEAAAKARVAATSQIAYSIGLSIGDGLRKSGATSDLDTAAIGRGIKDAIAGKAGTQDDRDRINAYMMELRNGLGQRNKETAKKFLAENAKNAGIVTTASGLQYRITEAGDTKAAMPQASDSVTVHYRGKLLDGSEFDSSYQRGQPAKFPVGGVIKGWTEALQLLHPGAKATLYVPPELAYDMNSPGRIPPGSLLVFDVELISVEPAPAPVETPKP